MDCDRELAAALWAVVSPRLERCGRRLDELEQQLRAGAGALPPAAELRAAREETEALGWLMGCLAGALDSALFSERRSRAGLGWVLEVLGQACSSRGRALQIELSADAQLPAPSRAAQWACAEVLWLACAAGPRAARISARDGRWYLECSGALEPSVAERAESWSGSAPRSNAAAWSWELGCRIAGEQPT